MLPSLWKTYAADEHILQYRLLENLSADLNFLFF